MQQGNVKILMPSSDKPIDLLDQDVIDLDVDLIVSQAVIYPESLKLILADKRFFATDNALLTAIINGKNDSANILFNSGATFETRTFFRAMPFLFMQELSLVETVFRHMPSSESIDLMRAMVDEDIWMLE